MAPLAGMGGIEGACAAAALSRAGFYRHFERHAPAEAHLELRDLVQRLALEHRFYGHRRIQALLRLMGWVVNRKRVLRIMREDNLLSLRRRRDVLTTNSRHPYFVYPNLAASAPICGCDQLWVADITYIRLAESFAYLAVILDAYSRRVIGWELGETLEAKLAIAALEMALRQRRRWEALR
ncbi:MAG TPA: IS3 family transposase [Terriglobales bacterium]|nr:IS3 family transposase [Terriglobales bacterium]